MGRLKKRSGRQGSCTRTANTTQEWPQLVTAYFLLLARGAWCMLTSDKRLQPALASQGVIKSQWHGA